MTYYRLPQRKDPKKSSIGECILAVIGALFMVVMFLAAVKAVTN